MQEYYAKLIASRDLAPEVRHFVFEVAGTDRVSFAPGQFVSVTEKIGGREVTRAYSIASPPDGRRIELCLNRVAAGLISPHLFGLHPGDSVRVSAPLGHFVPREPLRDSVFVATGTGIAPIRSMLHHILAHGAERRLTLLFGARYPSGLLYRQEFEALARQHENFLFLPTLSRPDKSWGGRSGHVQEHLDVALSGSLDNDVYLCGLRAMVDDVRTVLKRKGFDRNRIIYEKYD
ncbi:MAG: FAD-binding oxidoreductase [Acidobacteria bacterium]|nr:FAD-binding oxidoreductase [Acidobacteriota bacterium]